MSPTRTPAGKNDGKKPQDDGFLVRVTNTSTGAQEYVRMPFSERVRRLYTLWPTFTPYIIGFGLLGLSFIAHTLRLFIVFGVLLGASAVLVAGTAIYRFIHASK